MAVVDIQQTPQQIRFPANTGLSARTRAVPTRIILLMLCPTLKRSPLSVRLLPLSPLSTLSALAVVMRTLVKINSVVPVKHLLRESREVVVLEEEVEEEVEEEGEEEVQDLEEVLV